MCGSLCAIERPFFKNSDAHGVLPSLIYMFIYNRVCMMRCEASRVAMCPFRTPWFHSFTFPTFPLFSDTFFNSQLHNLSSISTAPHSLLPSFSQHFPCLPSPLVIHRPGWHTVGWFGICLVRRGRYQSFFRDSQFTTIFPVSVGQLLGGSWRTVTVRV